MGFENTWRWFGPLDPIGLPYVKQTGATGIVTSLHHLPVGVVWTVDEILKRKALVEAEGLRWSVVESLPVHEDIKKHTRDFRKYTDAFKQSLVNLGKSGIETVCYNFMPVLDWSRTDLHVVFKDGSITTKFELRAFAAFDLFQLERPEAERDYSNDQKREAQEYFEGLSEDERKALIQTVLLGLPGSGDAYTLGEFRKALSDYRAIGESALREHLYTFLREIVPIAEESGIRLAIHPDDPPRSLLGLPRIVSNEKDLAALLAVADTPANGLTFCTGSLGAGLQNDPVHLAERFAQRISFIHLRNVKKSANGDFVEDNHLEGDVDMYGVVKALLIEQKRRKESGRKDYRIPLRPDHGHFMLADEKFGKVYPGYSLFGRMRGLAELRGLELGIQRSLGL